MCKNSIAKHLLSLNGLKKLTENVDHGVFVANLCLALNHVANGALDGLWNLVHVLRFDHRLEVVLQHLGEVVLQLGTAKVRQNLGPLGWILCAIQSIKTRKRKHKCVP